MTPTFAAPQLTDIATLSATLLQEGFAVLDAAAVHHAAGGAAADFEAWAILWRDLPADGYLRDGGRYRRRRHSSFTVDGSVVAQVPHRPHWQPLDYNALHGGLERHFEPMPSGLVATMAWKGLLCWLGSVASNLRATQPWFVEAHQFRIDTTDGIGRPTPEGAHRDGVDLVAVFLVDRQNIKGGETRVFQAHGPQGQRFTLTQPWSVLLLDDAKVIHESTPIQPVQSLQPGGYRDTLVVTLRSKAFQDA